MRAISKYSSRLRLSKFAPFKRQSSDASSTDLKGILAEKIIQHQKRISRFRSEYGNTKIGEITVDMIYGGMRGMVALLYETSHVDDNVGIKYRGLTIEECQKRLPKAPGGSQPLTEGTFWLLLTGDVPNSNQAKHVSKIWAEKAELPAHVVTLLHNLPVTVHPVAQLTAAVTVLNRDSKFIRAYSKGVKKAQYWEYVYEDTLDLIAKLPTLCATIYNNMYKEGATVATADITKDWCYNFCHMMELDNADFIDYIRLYITLLCDHEGGNVTAHAVHMIGSALTDPYMSLAAGITGLAGPLHGLASEEVVVWLEEIIKTLGKNPTKEQLTEHVWNTLKSGKVVPGYGHSILRQVDPRYRSIAEFCAKHMPDDPLFKLALELAEIVPPVLDSLGKIKNPHQNMDALSGLVFRHYGLTETKFYIIMFALSRSIGVLCSLIWARALGFPMERPKSITSENLMKTIR